MKKCTKCGELKDLEFFSKMSRSRDGRYPSCKQCQKDSYAGLNLENIDCKQCGLSFKPVQKKSEFCSKACGQKYRDQFRVRINGSGHAARKGVCTWCDSVFYRHVSLVNMSKSCSRACAANVKIIGKFTPVFFHSCKICLGVIKASSKSSCVENHCYKCKARYGYNIYAVSSGRTKTSCTNCGVSFSRIPPGKSKCCSLECSLELKRASHRKGKALRKSLKRKSLGGERFDPFEILERDNWTCQMCGIATPKEKRGHYSHDAPELDHIIPVSKGGLHTRMNTQCLCRECNADKSDNIIVR